MNGQHILYSGPSMKPLLRDGDMLEVQQACFDKLRKWDVIAFRVPRTDLVAVHRIVEIEPRKKHVRTKGDGGLVRDPFHLNESNIIGRVVSYSRGGKTIPLSPALLYGSYLYSKVIHPYRKIKSIIRAQTIFRQT